MNRKINLKASKSLKERLQEYSDQKEISQASTVRLALDEYLSQKEA